MYRWQNSTGQGGIKGSFLEDFLIHSCALSSSHRHSPLTVLSTSWKQETTARRKIFMEGFSFEESDFLQQDGKDGLPEGMHGWSLLNWTERRAWGSHAVYRCLSLHRTHVEYIKRYVFTNCMLASLWNTPSLTVCWCQVFTNMSVKVTCFLCRFTKLWSHKVFITAL